MTNETRTRELQFLAERVSEANGFLRQAEEECARHVFGMAEATRKMLISMVAGGHVLLEGMPGLAKTRLANAIAQAISADFKRIQFTPDLMPSDIIGSLMYSQHTGQFSTRLGPVFTNILLADEINRAPAKVQSALLEAMQEGQVTIGDATHRLDELFFVVATSNPIDQDGTFNLPLAQTDRFAIKINIDYPAPSDELRIIDELTGAQARGPLAVATRAEVLRAREIAKGIYIDPKISDYIISLVCATRRPKDYGADAIADYIEYGASPRATVWLATLARARAFSRSRSFVTPDDVKYFASDVLTHRIGLNYLADSDSVSPIEVINEIKTIVAQP